MTEIHIGIAVVRGSKMEYREGDLVRIAKRENNTKRNYLVVDPLQGKHIPVSPTKALQLFADLAETLRGEYNGERLLLVGFAETATAIGAQAAVTLGAKYMNTTREPIPGVEYLFFSEEHSHATEQKLVKDDIEAVADSTDRIIFIEDEVTTGKTILNIITILDRMYPDQFKYSVASLLNGMQPEHLAQYAERGISLHYLVKTDHSGYIDRAECFAGDGAYYTCEDYASVENNLAEINQLNVNQLTVDQLFEEPYKTNYSNVLLLVPKIIFDNIDNIDITSTQLWFSISSYLIKEIVNDKITLVGIDNDKEYEKTVSYETLVMMNKITLKPDGEAVQIYELKRTDVTRKDINENILKNMYACLYDCYEYDNTDFLYYSGKGGYQKTSEILTQYEFLNDTTKKILIGSMVSGTNFFYRREYAEILENSQIYNCEYCNDLKLAGGYWRKLSRLMINNLIYNYKIDADSVKSTLEKIQYLETNFFKNFTTKISGLLAN